MNLESTSLILMKQIDVLNECFYTLFNALLITIVSVKYIVLLFHNTYFQP